MTPEGRWLRHVAAQPPGHADVLPDALAPERAVPRDAARVLAIAEVQRLAARVGARLAATDTADVPGGAELVAAWRRGLGDETLAADTLGDLGARAQAAGLPLLALKGADLALRVYGPGERAGNDIDLLVPPGRFEDAVRLLEDAGFRGDHPSPAWARSHWFAVTFRHARRARVQVDLHWGLGPPARTHWDQ